MTAELRLDLHLTGPDLAWLIFEGEYTSGVAVPEMQLTKTQLRQLVESSRRWLETVGDLRRKFRFADNPLVNVELETDSDADSIEVVLRDGTANIRTKYDRSAEQFTMSSMTPFKVPWESVQLFITAFIGSFSTV